MFLIFISLFQVFSFADWTDIDLQDFPLDAPPKIGSRVDHQDYLQLLEYQETRTDEQCEQAERQWIPYFAALFQYSGALTKEESELTEPIVTEVFKVTKKVTDHYKKFFAKERPYDRFSDIEPCVKKVSGKTSYPSSHAALGTVGACVLAKVFPKKKAALLEHGWDIGELRVIAGLHHPSDVEAGRDIGQKLCDYLSRQQDFSEAIQDLK